ncbi:MAG: glycoside hydrolase domain-containing protein [Streptococcus sp.]
MLVYPDYYRHFLEGFLNTYQDTNFLPKWLAPDERGMTLGTLIDGVFADAVTKGIKIQTYMKTCSQLCSRLPKNRPHSTFCRHGNETITLGYLNYDFHESVSYSLDYAHSDFCIATVAAIGPQRNSRSVCCF